MYHFDPLLARIWLCHGLVEKEHFEAPLDPQFLSVAQTCQKLCFNCWTTYLEMKFSTSLLSATETAPNIPTTSMEETTAATLGFCLLGLDLNSLHVQDWGKNLVFLREHFCLHYENGCSKEMRKTFPLCPVKTPELSSLQKRGLLKNREGLRESSTPEGKICSTWTQWLW